MNPYWRGLAVAVLVLCAAPRAAQAGTLSDFEQAGSGGGHAYGHGHDESVGDACLSDIAVDVLSDVAFVGFAYGGVASWQRARQEEGGDVLAPPRELGESLIPFLRVDAVYQFVEEDVGAVNARVEAGYGPVGLHVDGTWLDEDVPDDRLTLVRLFGLYRMSFDRFIEVDLGIGALTIHGEDTAAEAAFTVPVRVNLGDVLGVEFRPAWTETVSDYDMAALLGWRVLSLKAGYRWVHRADASLDGPYVGAALRF